MTFVVEVFVKCFELNGTHSMSINFMLAALRTPPINPKENKKKKRQKKRKKKATILSGEALGCQGFLEKNTTSQTFSLLNKG
jgi:hypothetical protein